MQVGERKLLFIVGCIPVRFLIALSPLILKEYLLKFLSVILAVIGLSFLALYHLDLRLSAREGGGITWWKDLRPMHGISYVAAGLSAARGQILTTSCILMLDLVIGVVSWLRHHDMICLFR